MHSLRRVISALYNSQVSAQAMIPASSSAAASIFTAKTASAGDSFLSFLNLSSTGVNNDVATETPPVTRALKNSEAVSTLLANTAAVPAVPFESQALPLTLSFNIFGATHNTKISAPHQTTEDKVAAPVQQPQRSTPESAPFSATRNLTPVGAPALDIVPAAKTSPSESTEASALDQSKPDQAKLDQSNDNPPAPAGRSVQDKTTTSGVVPPAASLPPAVTNPAPAALVTTPSTKSDRPRSANSNSAPAPVASQSTSTAQTLTLPAVVPMPPANLPAAAPVDVKTPAVADAAERSTQQTQPTLNLATEVTAQTAAPVQLAFALRVKPDGSQPPATQQLSPAPRSPVENSAPPSVTPAGIAAPAPAAPAPAAPAPAAMMSTQRDAAEPKPSNPSDQALVPAAPSPSPAEISPSATVEPARVLANKPATPGPAAYTVATSEYQSGQNAAASSGSGAKGGDTNRDSSRNTDSKAEPSPAPGPASTVPAQGFNIPAASAPSAPAATSAPSHATQQTVGTVSTPANEAPKTGAANQISITVPAGDQQNVQVRLTDRGGEVRVSVHAPNEELAGTLRQDLGSLTTRLNQSGFSTEAFTPSTGGETLSRDQKNGDPQPQNQDSSGRQTPGRSPQQQNSQQNGQNKRPAWLDEFEGSMAN